MNASSPKLNAKDIYQKSVRLLTDTQTQLSTMRKVLKKTLVSLSSVSHSGNDEVNDVLAGLKIPDDNKDLDFLDSQLDNLLVLIKHSNSDQVEINSDASIATALVDIVAGLSLKGDMANKEKASLLEMLKQTDDTDTYWQSVISKNHRID